MSRSMPRGMLFLGLALAAGLPGASPASAELRHTTVYKDNPVRGTTPRALWEYMIRHPIIDPDDGPAYANLTHDHKLTFKVKTVDGACRVNDLTFSWKFVITVPKAVDQAGMDATTSAMWKEFIGYLKTHEARHGDIFLECGKDFVPRAEAMTGPPGCIGIDRKVRKYVDAQYDLCMKKQRDFDHGETQTVQKLRLIQAAEKAGIRAPGF